MNRSDDDLSRAEQRAVAEEALSVIRHDLRNKLAAVRQASFYLQTKSKATALWEADPRFPTFFDLIHDQLVAADNLLTDHEALEKLGHRSVVPVAVSRVIERAVAAAALPAELRVRCGGDLDATLVADEADLVLALRCLLENASDASGAGGTVEVETRREAGRYVFAVVDSGGGLSDAEFRRFTRPFASKTEGRRGLGLSIARRVAARYGGSLELVPSAAGARIELAVAHPEGTK